MVIEVLVVAATRVGCEILATALASQDGMVVVGRASSAEEAGYEWQLLCRLVLPLIGHLPPERVSDQHRQAVEFLLHRDGRSRFIVKQALRTLDVVLERERQPESA